MGGFQVGWGCVWSACRVTWFVWRGSWCVLRNELRTTYNESMRPTHLESTHMTLSDSKIDCYVSDSGKGPVPAMQIRVYATLRDIVGRSTIEMPVGAGMAAGQVLTQLAGDHPGLQRKLWDADGQLTGFVTVLLNGRALDYLNGLDTLVADDDTMSLFPPVGGG